jgi:hypothetical protein
MNASTDDPYLAALAATAASRPDVVGLVAFGSTADRGRRDQWSDHDFAWVVAPGREQGYRDDLGWLPETSRIVLSVAEDHGGVKVVYDDGRLAEFGVTSAEGLSSWMANRTETLVDRGGVDEAMDGVMRRTAATTPVPARAVGLLVTAVLVGAGRARRGELLSAGQLVRGEAAGHLLTAWRECRHPGDPRLDRLDPRRRVEVVDPGFAAELETALRLDPDECGRRLLELAERELAPGWDDFPARAIEVVRARLGWDGRG